MKLNQLALTLFVVMSTASVAGLTLHPTRTAAESGGALALESVVPRSFGTWTEVASSAAQVINPQTKEILDKLYSQTLVRTYVNQDGYRIMLSLAYGDDQRGGLAAHRPEICYPAQGFKVAQMLDGVLNTRYGSIDVRRLSTSQGARTEPVTYWLTFGDQVIQSALERRIAQIRLGLTGQIPDGLLFRVSSIDKDDDRAFKMQQTFAADMLGAVPPAVRRRLSGLTSVTPTASSS